jgi:hypothetical protein
MIVVRKVFALDERHVGRYESSEFNDRYKFHALLSPSLANMPSWLINFS